MHTDLIRNAWQGLTRPQIAQLDEALASPERCKLRPEDAYAQIAMEYSRRCAHALTSNDLRAAQDAGAIAVAAEQLAQEAHQRRHAAFERLAHFQHMHPDDPAVRYEPQKPGQRKRARRNRDQVQT